MCCTGDDRNRRRVNGESLCPPGGTACRKDPHPKKVAGSLAKRDQMCCQGIHSQSMEGISTLSLIPMKHRKSPRRELNRRGARVTQLRVDVGVRAPGCTKTKASPRRAEAKKSPSKSDQSSTDGSTAAMADGEAVCLANCDTEEDWLILPGAAVTQTSGILASSELVLSVLSPPLDGLFLFPAHATAKHAHVKLYYVGQTRMGMKLGELEEKAQFSTYTGPRRTCSGAFSSGVRLRVVGPESCRVWSDVPGVTAARQAEQCAHLSMYSYRKVYTAVVLSPFSLSLSHTIFF